MIRCPYCLYQFADDAAYTAHVPCPSERGDTAAETSSDLVRGRPSRRPPSQGRCGAPAVAKFAFSGCVGRLVCCAQHRDELAAGAVQRELNYAVTPVHEGTCEAFCTKPLFVRCEDCTVFQVDRATLEPKTCGIYDAYCFTDPRVDVEYMSHSDWVRARNVQWQQQRDGRQA